MTTASSGTEITAETGNNASSTSSTGTRVLGLIIAVGVPLLVWLGLVATNPDVDQGDAYRPLYVHAPIATVTYLFVYLCAAGSVMWLWKRSEFWDVLGAAAGEIATVFAGLTLVTGMLWGRITWGVFWQWDPRLTTSLLLFLVLVGYLAVRSAQPDRQARATSSAALGIGAAVLVPLVHYSVEFWRSLHQGRTVVGTDDAKADGLQLFSLMFGMALFLVIGAWLLIHRFRVGWLEREAEGVEIDQLIAARRAHSTDTAIKAGPEAHSAFGSPSYEGSPAEASIEPPSDQDSHVR